VETVSGKDTSTAALLTGIRALDKLEKAFDQNNAHKSP